MLSKILAKSPLRTSFKRHLDRVLYVENQKDLKEWFEALCELEERIEVERQSEVQPGS